MFFDRSAARAHITVVTTAWQWPGRGPQAAGNPVQFVGQLGLGFVSVLDVRERKPLQAPRKRIDLVSKNGPVHEAWIVRGARRCDLNGISRFHGPVKLHLLTGKSTPWIGEPPPRRAPSASHGPRRCAPGRPSSTRRRRACAACRRCATTIRSRPARTNAAARSRGDAGAERNAAARAR